MLLLLVFFLCFFLTPLTAWAYFDPGFGGYLINSIISLLATGFAFASAAFIYFFRTIIGRNAINLWRNHQSLCIIILLPAFCSGSFFLGRLLPTFNQPSHPPFAGVHIIDPSRVSPGYNLYNGTLIDENGRIVKQWAKDQGVLDQNGDFYGKLDKDTWGRYTWDDRAIWEKHFPIDHGIYLTPQGTVIVFTTETRDYNHHQVNFDIILEFDKNGRQLQRYSFWDHREEFRPYHAEFNIDTTFLSSLRFPFLEKEIYDYFHINCLCILPPNALEDKNPAFHRGNWLISLLHGSMVFILDRDTKKILWHMVSNDIEGSLQGQHSVSMLPTGDILLFENGDDRKASRILLIDPLTLTIKWQYSQTHFFSTHGGFVQVLANGNFLITESHQGHAFEVTPDKKIVWEFYNREKGNDPELKIYYMIRYPKGMIKRFLQ